MNTRRQFLIQAPIILGAVAGCSKRGQTPTSSAPTTPGAVATIRKSCRQGASTSWPTRTASSDRTATTVYSHVFKGMDVVEKIVSVLKDSTDQPLTPITLHIDVIEMTAEELEKYGTRVEWGSTV